MRNSGRGRGIKTDDTDYHDPERMSIYWKHSHVVSSHPLISSDDYKRIGVEYNKAGASFHKQERGSQLFYQYTGPSASVPFLDSPIYIVGEGLVQITRVAADNITHISYGGPGRMIGLEAHLYERGQSHGVIVLSPTCDLMGVDHLLKSSIEGNDRPFLKRAHSYVLDCARREADHCQEIARLAT